MLTRRRFLAGTTGAVGAAALTPPFDALAQAAQSRPATPPAAAPASTGNVSAEIRALYDRAIVIDSTTIGGPDFAVDQAIDSGMTASIVDLPIYPRTYANAITALTEWSAAFRREGSKFVKVLKAADIETAKRERRFGVVLACQDASILDASTFSVHDSNLRTLELFYDLGLRVLQMTHNERNAVGDAFREKRDAGLSRLGEAVVDRMNALRMIVDVSHCSDLTTLEAIERSTLPCVISHSACRALYNTKRNKTDEQIRAVAAKGGLFGVYNMTLWMTDKPTSSVDTVLDHIDHAVRLAGEDHVAFGSDQAILKNDTPMNAYLAGMRAYAQRNLGLPGAERIPDHVMAEELNHPQRMLRLADALSRRGYKAAAIEKIIGGNVVRVFRDVCG